MTDKQLERGNQIKKELTELEQFQMDGSLFVTYGGPIISNVVVDQIAAMNNYYNKRIEKLISHRIAELKKEFAKL